MSRSTTFPPPKKCSRKALRSIPIRPNFISVWESFWRKWAKSGKAFRYLKTAIKKDPFHVMALNYLGYTYADRGIHLDEAEDLIKRALKFRPNDGYIIDSLGWVYFKKKRYDEALVEMEKAWKLAPNDPVVGEHLGEVYLKKGLWDKAIKILRRVLEVNPSVKEKETILKKIKEAQQRLEEEKGGMENSTFY